MHRYVLIDAAARPDTPQAIGHHAQDLQHRSLFAHQPEAEHADLGPWLMQLPEHGQSPVESWLLALEHNHPAVAWLTSEAAFEPVFAHLEGQLDIALADGSLALLRYWDTRVFRRLQRVMTAQQRLDLLGPIDIWRARVGAWGIEVVVDRMQIAKEAA